MATPWPTRLLRACLIAFFVYHSYAVFVYSIPREERRWLPRAVLNFSVPYLTPYLFATSQWQMWNLFAPDPLRRVTHGTIVGQTESGEWRVLVTTTSEELPWWRTAKEFKVLRRVMEEDRLLQHFILAQCRLAGKPLRAVRMEIATMVVAPRSEVLAQGGWRTFQPQWNRRTVGPLPCPRTEEDLLQCTASPPTPASPSLLPRSSVRFTE